VSLTCSEHYLDCKISISDMVPIGEGTDPHIEFSVVNNSTETPTIMVVETNAEGYCFNSDWHNKRAYPLVCDSTPNSCEHIMNYNYGNFEDWKEQILNGDDTRISSCHNSIMHGDYDLGKNPNFALLFNPVENKLSVLEVHEGFGNQSLDTCGCGYPLPFNGVVLDSWDINIQPLMQNIRTSYEVDEKLPNIVHQEGIEESECDECKTLFFNMQYTFEHDYTMVYSFLQKMAQTCNVSDIIIGDGTYEGCMNLIYLYGMEVSVEAIQSIYSSSNCVELGYCTSEPKKLA